MQTDCPHSLVLQAGWPCDSIIESLLKEEVQVVTEGSINAFSRGWIQLIARFNFFLKELCQGRAAIQDRRQMATVATVISLLSLSRVSSSSSKIVLDRYIEILTDKSHQPVCFSDFLDAYVYWSSLHIHSIFSVHFQQTYNHLMLIDVVECFFVNCLFNQDIFWARN